jgi:hypothetical protein
MWMLSVKPNTIPLRSILILSSKLQLGLHSVNLLWFNSQPSQYLHNDFCKAAYTKNDEHWFTDWMNFTRRYSNTYEERKEITIDVTSNNFSRLKEKTHRITIPTAGPQHARIGGGGCYVGHLNLTFCNTEFTIRSDDNFDYCILQIFLNKTSHLPYTCTRRKILYMQFYEI